VTNGTYLNEINSVYVSGKYAYTTSYASDSVAIIDINGVAFTSADIGNIRTSSLEAKENLIAKDVYLRGGLIVSETSTFYDDVSVGGTITVKDQTDNKSLIVASGDKTCFDGSTCAVYQYYNGTHLVTKVN